MSIDTKVSSVTSPGRFLFRFCCNIGEKGGSWRDLFQNSSAISRTGSHVSTSEIGIESGEFDSFHNVHGL